MKNLVFSQALKCSQSIRLEYSLIIISLEGINLSLHLIKDLRHLGQPLLVGCGQLSLSSTQIEGFFDFQQLWKEWINLIIFLQGDNHQRKVACQTISWLGVASYASHPIRLRDCLINSICEENQVNLGFFTWRLSSRKENTKITFWLGVVCCVLFQSD